VGKEASTGLVPNIRMWIAIRISWLYQWFGTHLHLSWILSLLYYVQRVVDPVKVADDNINWAFLEGLRIWMGTDEDEFYNKLDEARGENEREQVGYSIKDAT